MALLNTDQTPTKTISLKYCTVSFYDHWAWTQFPDGQGYGAYPEYEESKPFWPNYTDHYRAVAAFAGYPDPLRFCLEHDFFHSFLAQALLDMPSMVLWSLAHGEPSPPLLTTHEESVTLLGQRYFNGGDMFATSPHVPWEKIREDAKNLLTRP